MAGASLLLGLALLLGAEGLARLWHPADGSVAELVALHGYSEIYGWAPRPGARFVADGITTTINAHGYRGRIASVIPPAGVKRVVLLGDSVTFGTDVPDDQTFAARLDAEAGLDVVNLAVQGYGLDQDLLKLEHEGLAFRPRVVLLNVCLDNDLADIAQSHFLYDGQHPKPYYSLENGELVLHSEHVQRSWRARLSAFLRARSRLYDWVVAGAAARQPTAVEDEHWTVRKGRALTDPRIQELGLHLIARIRQRAAASGASLVVALHPDKASFRRGSPWIELLLESPLLAGARVIDLRREYLARGARWQNLAFDTIGHLTPAGHRLAAEVLSAALARDDDQAAAGPDRSR